MGKPLREQVVRGLTRCDGSFGECSGGRESARVERDLGLGCVEEVRDDQVLAREGRSDLL